MPNMNAQSVTVKKKKVSANVQKKVNGQGQGHTFKIYVTIGKALS